MSEEKTRPNDQQRARIDIHADREVQRWCKKFGVASDQLRSAVLAVGTQPQAVVRHLNERSS